MECVVIISDEEENEEEKFKADLALAKRLSLQVRSMIKTKRGFCTKLRWRKNSGPSQENANTLLFCVDQQKCNVINTKNIDTQYKFWALFTGTLCIKNTCYI